MLYPGLLLASPQPSSGKIFVARLLVTQAATPTLSRTTAEVLNAR